MFFLQNLLPVKKLKVCPGSWNPATVLSLIELGIDIFDSSYAYLATEKKKALVFLYEETSEFFIGEGRYGV